MIWRFQVNTHLDLINSLASDVRPVSPKAINRHVAEALIAGGGIALVGVIAFFGIQPGLDSFAHGEPLLIKSAYALSLAGITIALTLLMSRPGAWNRHGWRWITAPVAGLGLLALMELARHPMTHWPRMVMGESWAQCPWRIAALSIPVLLGLCVAIRSQAPTDLRSSGAAAGLLSGAVAATAYALACPESSAAFILVWYSLGIALATGLGAVLGPKLLRW
jgi:hypothetical protein